jgi:hypothetical protein
MHVARVHQQQVFGETPPIRVRQAEPEYRLAHVQVID